MESLQPGDRLLMQAAALDGARCLSEPSPRGTRSPIRSTQKLLAPLQEWALKRIGERFEVRVIHRDDDFVVATLAPRR